MATRLVSRRWVLGAAAALAAPPLCGLADPGLDADVVVIGAGAAGLAAAGRLSAARRRVVTLEARPRIGGRAFTDEVALGLPFDRGAHWLHSAQANPFVRDAARLRRRTWRSLGDDVLVLLDGVATEDPWAAMGALERRAAQRMLNGADVALGVVAHGAMEAAAARLSAFAMATDADRLSARDHAALADGEDRVVEGGFGRLVADLAAAVPVRLGHAVERIDWSAAERVAVSGAFGVVTARRVVVTVPPPVLAAGALRIDPALPQDRQAALAALEGGRFVKVGMRLDAPLVDAPEFIFDLASGRGGATVGVHLDRRLPLATAIFAGAHAESVSRDGAAALEAAGREALAATAGSDAAARVRAATSTDWSADPLARGAYATTVMGARLSGEAAADAILALPR